VVKIDEKGAQTGHKISVGKPSLLIHIGVPQRMCSFLVT
jgi:hypothetical protein